MNFIQKMLLQKNLEKEQKMKSQYSYTILNVEKFITIIKSDISNIADERRNITRELIRELMLHILQIEDMYNRFLHDLKQTEFTYENTYSTNIKANSKQKAEFMHKLKKQYRVEFEKIYDTFKRITKGNDFPRRNEILGLMRNAFDFDSSKYYAPDQFIIMH